jgi:hypothetical protein
MKTVSRFWPQSLVTGYEAVLRKTREAVRPQTRYPCLQSVRMVFCSSLPE